MKNETMFKEYMAGMGEMFDKKISKFLSDAYWKALEKYSDAECKLVFDRAMVSCKFFPKPVDLIEMLQGGTVEDKAMYEATQALESMKRIGKYQSVKFTDETTQAVIMRNFGGWEKLCCELLEKDEKWFLRDFMAAYRSYARSGVKVSGHLPGFHERVNSASGHDYPEPLLIGMDEIKKIAES